MPQYGPADLDFHQFDTSLLQSHKALKRDETPIRLIFQFLLNHLLDPRNIHLIQLPLEHLLLEHHQLLIVPDSIFISVADAEYPGQRLLKPGSQALIR